MITQNKRNAIRQRIHARIRAKLSGTGERPRLPARLGDLMERAERVDGLPNDLAALETMIDERMALAREPAPVRAKVRI